MDNPAAFKGHTVAKIKPKLVSLTAAKNVMFQYTEWLIGSTAHPKFPSMATHCRIVSKKHQF